VSRRKIRGSETPDNPAGRVVSRAAALREANSRITTSMRRAGFRPGVVVTARGEWELTAGAGGGR
jgi:hypothetical protein